MLNIFLLFLLTDGFVAAFRSRLSKISTSYRYFMMNDTPTKAGDEYYQRRSRRIRSSPSVVTKTKAEAQAHELQITLPLIIPITSSSPCYFEHDKMCGGATKSGICPIDNRPCDANRGYLDELYKSAAPMQHQSSLEDEEWQQQLQQWRLNGERGRDAYDKDLQEKRAQERVRLDVMEEPRPARRFFNDVIDTVRIVVHIGKLVVHAVVYQVHNLIKDSIDRGKGRQQQ